MNTSETLNQLDELKLKGMSSAYQSQLDLPMHQQLESHEMIAHLVQTELNSRINERTSYYLKLAKLRIPATPEQIKCSASRNLTKQQLAYLDVVKVFWLVHSPTMLARWDTEHYTLT